MNFIRKSNITKINNKKNIFKRRYLINTGNNNNSGKDVILISIVIFSCWYLFKQNY